MLSLSVFGSCADDVDEAPLPTIERAPRMLINEVSNTGDDWIELRNNTDALVALGGWTVRDSRDDRAIFLPAEARLEPGARLVLSRSENGAIGFQFGIGRTDRVRLFDANRKLVDVVNLAEQLMPRNAEYTWARFPEDEGPFAVRPSTRGLPNVEGDPACPTCCASCTFGGACAVTSFACELPTDLTCSQLPTCGLFGACAAANGGCGMTAASCPLSAGCAREGLCSLPAGGFECAPASEADCRAASGCRELGACMFADGACFVGSQADCEAQAGCAERARCTFDAASQACVVSSSTDCARTAACRAGGFCTAINGECRVGSEADCLASARCVERGECGQVGNSCRRRVNDVAECDQPAGTLGSRPCTDSGRCTLSDGQCIAASAEDCARCPSCVIQGRPRPVNGECVEPFNDDD